MTPEEANRAKQYLKEIHGMNDEFLTVQSANGLRYPLIDLMVAYAKHEAKFISSNLPVIGCACHPENRWGWTEVKCCNNCGKPMDKLWGKH